jgi:hypothetical protein
MRIPPFPKLRPLPKIRWSDLRPSYLRALAIQGAARARAWCLGPGRAKLADLPEEAWQALTAHRIRSLFTTLAAAAVVMGGLKLVPAVYARYALVHAADVAARQSLLKGEDRVVLELRHRAYDLGLMEAVLPPDVFRLEPTYLAEGPACAVSYDFIHRVDFYGLYRLPLRYRARVVRLSVNLFPNGLEAEETRSVPAVQQ